MYAIRKIAENHVELRKSRTIETATKQTVEAYVDPPEAYGQNRLDAELASLQAEKDRINNFDKTKELAKLQEKEDMLKDVEAAMKSATVVDDSPTKE